MKTTQATVLYSYYKETPISLEETIAQCHQVLVGAFAKHGRNPIALLYSPQSCQLARLKEGQLEDYHNQPINNWREIFEARIFNPETELRWLNRNQGKGEAVLITEATKEEQLKDFSALPPVECERIEPCQQYLLWGETAHNKNCSEGWQRLAEARIGKLDIPLDRALNQNQRVYLKTYEYLSNQSDEYGNFAVIEERLVQLDAT
jgi:CRISPR-associated protein (TIGR03984 family)